MNEVARIHHCPYASIDRKTCAARPGIKLPWQASITRGDKGQTDHIGPLFAGFPNTCINPRMRTNHLISRRISGLIRLFIRRDHPAADQG
jgi:hypothetical protein